MKTTGFMKFMLRIKNIILTVALCSLLAACGTDSSSGNHEQGIGFGGKPTPGVSVSSSDSSTSNRAGFSLRLTDAPVDDLAKVVVQFTAVEMKRKKGGWTLYTLPAPQPIDLLALQGLTTADLLLHMAIEPDEYKQMRFIVDDTPMANYVELKTGGVFNLDIPNGSTTGIKIKQKFTIPNDRLVSMTVDFDLRKSVKYKQNLGIYRLKAKTRLLIDDNVGLLRGTVNPALLIAPGCSDLDPDTHNAVYVYNGHDTVTDDIDETSTINNEPVTTTTLLYDSAIGLYIYEAAFLPQGDYTIAFTCSADVEDLEADDNLPFFHSENATVLVSDTTFLKP